MLNRLGFTQLLAGDGAGFFPAFGVLQRVARQKLAYTRMKVDFITQSAETPLPFQDESMDTIVATWTLCSIPNAMDALKEMKRILKRSGSFIFLEHGRGPDARVVGWQNRLTPIWK